MNNNKLNEKDLENVTGGTGMAQDINGYTIPRLEIPTGKYSMGQKVRFINPKNPAEELIGIIAQPPLCIDSEGTPIYSIDVTTPEQKVQNLAVIMYLVSEKDILEVIG